MLCKSLRALLQFVTSGGSGSSMIISCPLAEEGVLVFEGRLLEDGLPVAFGSSAKGTWLAFVSVFAHLCASAKLSQV